MRNIIIMRHGKTTWNDLGKIQGKTNTDLSEEGRNQISKWSLPSHCNRADWICSPLTRTMQTAALLGIQNPKVNTDLEEMDWGDWTGKTLSELRQSEGVSFQENEQKGLDFQTPNGESPRDVRNRVKSFLNNITANEQALCIVTHKGVIRAFISIATGWDLKSDYPEKLKRDALHYFTLDTQGVLHLSQLNIPTVQ